MQMAPRFRRPSAAPTDPIVPRNDAGRRVAAQHVCYYLRGAVSWRAAGGNQTGTRARLAQPATRPNPLDPPFGALRCPSALCVRLASENKASRASSESETPHCHTSSTPVFEPGCAA